MNGKIDVTSEKGHGTTFKVEIPMQLSNDLSLLIDDEDYDNNENYSNFEFVICENRKSFGIQ